MLPRVLDGVDDFLKWPFSFNYGSHLTDPINFHLWMKSSDVSGLDKALISGEEGDEDGMLARVFGTTSDYLATGMLASKGSGNNFTVWAWVKWTNTGISGSQQAVLGVEDSGSGNGFILHIIRQSSSLWNIRFRPGNGHGDSNSSNISGEIANTARFVAVVNDSGANEIRFYHGTSQTGIALVNTVAGSRVLNSIGTPTSMAIGCRQNTNGTRAEPFPGQIGKVGLHYDVVLTLAQLKEVASAGSLHSSGATFYYKMVGDSPEPDSSPNNYDATVNGTTTTDNIVPNTNVGWGWYWNNAALKLKYFQRDSGNVNAPGFYEEITQAYSTPVDTPVFLAVNCTVTSNVPTWHFFAGTTPENIVEIGSGQASSGAIKSSTRRLYTGCRSAGNGVMQTPVDSFFAGSVERIGQHDSGLLSLAQLALVAARGCAEFIPVVGYEAAGVVFEMTGESEELDSGLSVWGLELIGGTTVGGTSLCPQQWEFKATLALDYPSPQGLIRGASGTLLLGGNESSVPEGKIFRSADNGASWPEQDPVTDAQAVCLIHLGSGVILAGTWNDGKIFKSTDNGSTWTDKGQLGTLTIIHTLFDLGGGEVLAGGNIGGAIWKSFDSGETWAAHTTITSGSGANHVNWFLDLGGGVILCAGSANRIHKSTDGGDTFPSFVTLPSPSGDVTDIIRVPTTDILMAMNGNGQVYTSQDLGLTWATVIDSDYQFFNRLVGPDDEGRFFAVAENYGFVYETPDNGVSWIPVSIPPTRYFSVTCGILGSLIVAALDYDADDVVMVWEMTSYTVPVEPPPSEIEIRVESAWRNIEYRYFGDPAPPAHIDPRVQILDSLTLLPVAEIEGYTDLHYLKSWTEKGRFDFKLDADSPDGINLKALGVIPSAYDFLVMVLIENVFDFAGIISIVQIEIDGEGHHLITVSGNGVEQILADKLAIPPAGQETDSYDDVAENVMRDLVDVNLINPQSTDVSGLNQAQRTVDLLDQTPNLNRGANVKVEARNQTVFDAVREAALQDGELGFQILIVAGFLMFDVYEGTDRSANVVFSFDRDNLSKITIRYDKTDYASHLIMAGQGEGAARAMQCAFITSEMGIKRRERFQDARELSSTTLLQQRGAALLALEGDFVMLSGERVPVSSPQYKTEFELGDTVLVSIPAYGLSVAKRIVEVEVTLSQGRPLDVRIAFGKARARVENMVLRSSVQATSRS